MPKTNDSQQDLDSFYNRWLGFIHCRCSLYIWTEINSGLYATLGKSSMSILYFEAAMFSYIVSLLNGLYGNPQACPLKSNDGCRDGSLDSFGSRHGGPHFLGSGKIRSVRGIDEILPLGVWGSVH